jgi:transcriptional regulator GlxA family with amidase domain
VHVLVYDGFDELDAVGPYETFATAGTFGADVAVSFATLEPRESVTASHGLELVPDVVLPDPGADADADDLPDLLVVPGGGWSDPDVPGAGAEARRSAVPDAVAALHDAGVRLAAVCTGGMLLATAGVLDGRPATTHASAREDLAGTGARLVEARVVDDGDVCTAGGVTSGIDLALHLVEREFGADVAGAVSTELEYERRGAVHGARDGDGGAAGAE